MKFESIFLLIAVLLFSSDSFAQMGNHEAKIEALLAKMTLKEKIGQMNQYTGFFDHNEPVPEGGDAAEKYQQIEAGLVG